jgi:hypothetical protein
MSFSDWILPSSTLTSMKGDGTTSFLFDEPTTEDLQTILDQDIENEYDPDVSVMAMADVVDQVPSDVLTELLRKILHRLQIETKYVYKHHKVIHSKVTNVQGITYIFVTLLICIHKPSCAYGKIIKTQAFYDSIGPHIVSSQIIGIVPEDRISLQEGYYSSMSLSSSASIMS